MAIFKDVTEAENIIDWCNCQLEKLFRNGRESFSDCYGSAVQQLSYDNWIHRQRLSMYMLKAEARKYIKENKQ